MRIDKEARAMQPIQSASESTPSAHARDELGISETLMARPIQAAFASAAAFGAGAATPLWRLATL